MNKLIILIVLIISIGFSCEEISPCGDLVNGVYPFPELPKHNTMTSQQVTEFWDLTEDICSCITTEGLIETCLNYPDLRLIYAGPSPQSGYDHLVKDRFLGIRELEKRPNRGTCLLKKYQTIDPLGFYRYWEPIEIGTYIINNVTNFEIIFSQYVNLKPLTVKEKIELVETAVVIYDEQKVANEDYGLFGLECTTTLLGRLMY
jgi:hypothetical protein